MLGPTLPALPGYLLGIVLKCGNYLQTTLYLFGKKAFFTTVFFIYASFKTALIAPQYLV